MGAIELKGWVIVSLCQIQILRLLIAERIVSLLRCETLAWGV